MMIEKIKTILLTVICAALCMGAAVTSSPYTGAGWNTAAPNDEALVGNAYLEVQDLRKGIELRINREHLTLASSSAGGWHLNGSAVCYEGTTAEPNLPDDSAALSNIARDRGRLWIDDNFDPPAFKRWDGSAYEELTTIASGSAPQAYFISDANENTDGGRESQIIVKGEKTDDTSHELGMIQVSHDGTGDDYKGDIIIFLNDGDDAAGSLTEVARISSAKLVTLPGAISITGDVAVNTNKFTVTAASGNTLVAGTLDVTGAAEVTGVATLGDASLLKTSAAPSTDAMIANKKYVDDAFPDDDAFGAWASKSNDTAYQAASDGLVCAWSNTGAGAINGYTDPNSDPTGTCLMSDYGADGKSRCVSFPVVKSHYWQVTGAVSVKWLPDGG